MILFLPLSFQELSGPYATIKRKKEKRKGTGEGTWITYSSIVSLLNLKKTNPTKIRRKVAYPFAWNWLRKRGSYMVTFPFPFHKIGTSSNALTACSVHCGWRGGKGAFSRCWNLRLMHKAFSFPPLQPSPVSSSFSPVLLLLFLWLLFSINGIDAQPFQVFKNKRRREKKPRVDIILALRGIKSQELARKTISRTERAPTKGFFCLQLPTVWATFGFSLSSASPQLSHPAFRDDVAVATSLGCNGKGG